MHVGNQATLNCSITVKELIPSERTTMKRTTFTACLPVFAAILLSLIGGSVRADDCSFGDCHLVREAQREQKEMLDWAADVSRNRSQERAAEIQGEDKAKEHEVLKMRAARLAREKKEADAATASASAAAEATKSSARTTAKKTAKLRENTKPERKST